MYVCVSRLDQIFTDGFSRDYQLIKSDPKSCIYLACALMLRGKVDVSDIRRNIDRQVKNMLCTTKTSPMELL